MSDVHSINISHTLMYEILVDREAIGTKCRELDVSSEPVINVIKNKKHTMLYGGMS